MSPLDVLFFDLVLVVILARIVYKPAVWLLGSPLGHLPSAAHTSIQRREHLIASSTEASDRSDIALRRVLSIQTTRLLDTGGIRGSTLDNDDLDADTQLQPFPHRHLLSQRAQQRLLALEYRPPPEATGRPSRGRTDWVAITDPRLNLEVVCFPQLVGIAQALWLRLASIQAISGILTALARMTRLKGTSRPMASTRPDLSPFARLPQELVCEIILLSASPSLSPYEPQSSPVSVLLLSKQYHRTLLPKLYHTVSLHTSFAFRSFRLTLALHNPSLGKLVRRLQIGSSQFDSSGYISGQLAEQGPLATGIEQILLATPNLLELSIDLFSLVAVHAGTASRLERGCQPRRLSTELTIIPYLSLPTFQDLHDLELLVFGLDTQTALELRVALPRLERLTLRFVTRRRSGATRRYTTLNPSAAVSDDDDDNQIYATPQDVDDLIDAIELLRTWPEGDSSSGQVLSSLIVYTWPSALSALKARIPEAKDVQERETLVCVDEMSADADAAVERDTPSCQLRAGLDTGYLLGPRRGAHVLWRKERARLAWS